MIKSFRGRLDHGTSTQLRLSTNKGLIGYKIKKFECITQEPGGHNVEHVTKLFTVKIDEVTTPTAVVNFDNPLLLGVNYYRDGTSTERNTDETIIFDHTVFNQDIYVAHSENAGSNKAINFYLELEQIRLDIGEATVATLKDMRGRE